MAKLSKRADFGSHPALLALTHHDGVAPMDVDFGQRNCAASGQKSRCPVVRPCRSDQRSRRRTFRQLILAGVVAMVASGSTGCSSVTSISRGISKTLSKSDCIDDFMIGHRNRVMAAKAWHREKDCYCDRKHLKEFREGFYQGYIDVASGSDGCTPAVAPKEYWGWQYQSPNGQSAVNAWFAGYPLGVKAAEQDGIIHWGEIRTVGMRTPQTSYPNAPYAEGPVVIQDANGVPMLNQPGIISVQDVPINGDTPDVTVPDTPSEATLKDAISPAADMPEVPGTGSEAAIGLPPGPLGSIEQTQAGLAATKDLVPADESTSFSFNDGPQVAVSGENMIEEIFGDIELPPSIDSGTPAPVPAASAEVASLSDSPLDVATAVESSTPVKESPVQTADASEDLSFKFE